MWTPCRSPRAWSCNCQRSRDAKRATRAGPAFRECGAPPPALWRLQRRALQHARLSLLRARDLCAPRRDAASLSLVHDTSRVYAAQAFEISHLYRRPLSRSSNCSAPSQTRFFRRPDTAHRVINSSASIWRYRSIAAVRPRNNLGFHTSPLPPWLSDRYARSPTLSNRRSTPALRPSAPSFEGFHQLHSS